MHNIFSFEFIFKVVKNYFLSLLSRSDEFKTDILPQLDKRNASKMVSQLKRLLKILKFNWKKNLFLFISKGDLDAKARSAAFRTMFRLSNREMLDGNVACSLWTPYNKKYIKGTIYISNNYITFASKVKFNLVYFKI